MKRVLCLYIPRLSIDRLAQAGGESVHEPVVVTDLRRGATVVVQCNRPAGSHGVRRGMTLAEARALTPQVTAKWHDALADRKALEALADWAYCLSPVVHIESTNTLLIDVTGCERLFRGEPNLLRRAVEGLHDQGFAARAAIADTPGAAWAVAHAHQNPAVRVEPGRSAAAIAPLPVWSLRVDSSTVAGLRAVGVETIEALLYLPRASLAPRFGDGLLLRIDQALGRMPEPLNPFRPPPPLTSRLRFDVSTNRHDILSEAIDRLLASFCDQLAAADSGVRRLCVTFYCDAAGPYTFDVNLCRPTRSAKRLRTLVHTRFEAFHPPADVHTVVLWTRQVETLSAWQDELFDTGRRDEAGLAELVDRLCVRLGPDGVVRPVLVSDHQPERAWRYEAEVTGTGTNGRANATRHGRSCEKPRGYDPDVRREFSRPSAMGDAEPLNAVGRPLQLLAEPGEVAAVALGPDGPPARFRWGGRQYDVATWSGPERIETGWWRGQHIRRDYYRVTSASGSAFWLFRDRTTGTWYLHGLFD